MKNYLSTEVQRPEGYGNLYMFDVRSDGDARRRRSKALRGMETQDGFDTARRDYGVNRGPTP